LQTFDRRESADSVTDDGSPRIRCAVLVDEYFSNNLPSGNGKGGYGIIAKNYLARYIPSPSIELETIIGFSESDDLEVIVGDHGDRILFLPANKPRNQAKTRQILDSYDVFLSLEFQSIANYVMRRTTWQKLVFWIQAPRTAADWRELDTVSIRKQVGYRPNPLTQSVMNWLFRGNRLVAITQAIYLVDKARELYDLPSSFSAALVPNPIEPADVSEVDLARKENIILALGRLDSVKRPWIIGEVAKTLPEYKFLFLGQSHDASLDQLMTPYFELANVQRLGQVEGERKIDLLRRSKLLINTSIHEGVPVSFLEALSYGVLLVSNRNPDDLTARFGYWTGQVNGDGFDAVDRFCSGVRELLADDAARVVLAREAVDYIAESHSIEGFQREVRRIIEASVSPRVLRRA